MIVLKKPASSGFFHFQAPFLEAAQLDSSGLEVKRRPQEWLRLEPPFVLD